MVDVTVHAGSVVRAPHPADLAEPGAAAEQADTARRARRTVPFMMNVCGWWGAGMSAELERFHKNEEGAAQRKVISFLIRK